MLPVVGTDPTHTMGSGDLVTDTVRLTVNSLAAGNTVVFPPLTPALPPMASPALLAMCLSLLDSHVTLNETSSGSASSGGWPDMGGVAPSNGPVVGVTPPSVSKMSGLCPKFRAGIVDDACFQIISVPDYQILNPMVIVLAPLGLK